MNTETKDMQNTQNIDNNLLSKGGKKPKKNKKGEDFLDYAKTNNIEISLKYDEDPNLKNELNEEGQNSNKNFKSYDRNFKGKNNKMFNKGQKKFVKKPFTTFKANNKFDLYNNNANPKFNNMINPNMMPMNFNSKMSSLDLFDNSDSAVLTFMDQYFSLENLNRDLYLRNRMREDGFVDAKDILNFNKLKEKEVTFEQFKELFGENTHENIEAKIENSDNEEILYLRNRHFEQIKDDILSIQDVQTNKRNFKSQNRLQTNMMMFASFTQGNGLPMNMIQLPNMMDQGSMNFNANQINYLSMQNNYFFNSPEGMNSMMMQHQNMMGNMNNMNYMNTNTTINNSEYQNEENQGEL